MSKISTKWHVDPVVSSTVMGEMSGKMREKAGYFVIIAEKI